MGDGPKGGDDSPYESLAYEYPHVRESRPAIGQSSDFLTISPEFQREPCNSTQRKHQSHIDLRL
jgi:hypothetical protein